MFVVYFQVITPKKYNDVYLYDMPPSRCSPVPIQGSSPRDFMGESYDVPPRAVPITYDVTKNCQRCSPAPSCVSPAGKDGEAYDIPRSLLSQQNQLTPSSSASSLTADSLSSSNRSSVVNMPDYDIPKPHNKGPHLVLHTPQHYDIPVPHSLRELPLELSSALETLEKLRSDTTSAISKLLSYVGPEWRNKDKLEANILDIKLAVERVKISLHDLAEFTEGALANAARASDKNLAAKLLPLVTALRNSDSLIKEAADKLNQQEWSVMVLARNEDGDRTYKLDELEQLVACSRTLTEDVRQAASFIHGNSTLLFKKDSIQSNNNGNSLEDYDYIHLESKESVSKQHAEIRDALPKEFKKGYDNLVKHADDVAFDSDSKSLAEDDKQVLSFFAAQVVTHLENLTQAIDAFLLTVERNQPPKVFLAHGKFVVLSAHKLVHIGDTVYRNISQIDLKERILNYANALSEGLAASVTKTKQAALQFPSVTAVQAMVDSVVDISHLAKDLKVCLVRAAQPL